MKVKTVKKIVGLTLLSGYLLFLLACENDLAEVQKFVHDDEVAIEVGEEVEVIYSDSGKIQVRMVAPILHRHMDKRQPKREFPNGLEVFFLDDDQKVKSWLVGRYAIQDERKHEMIFRDSVVLLNTRQEKLETEHLIWDEATEKIHTQQFVKITTADEQIWGYGFEADKEFTYWKIIAPQGRLKVNPNNLND